MNEETLNSVDYIEDNDFSFDGFQVVRGEFFAHIYEPSFTLNNYKCSVNTACIKKLPEFDYVQILVNPNSKLLAVRPCKEDEKDSFRWCSATTKRSPKQITCRIFYAKIMNLMNWDHNYRYKLLGKLIRSNNELLFVFDLNSPEIFKRTATDDGMVKTSRTASYSEDWKNQFGIPVVEHQSIVQVNTFSEHTVFGLKADPNSPHQAEKSETVDTTESVGTEYEQLTINQAIETNSGSNGI